MPRAVIIADDDSLVAKSNSLAGDVLISLGDLWDSTIEKAFLHHGCSQAVAVKGNHDSNNIFPEWVVPLHCAVVEVSGIVFGGFNGSWKYKPRGHHLFKQDEVAELMKDFPKVDVFVAHNSPRGIHERDPDVHQGFDGFTEYLRRTKPRYFLHGHQHKNCLTEIGETKVMGVFGESLLEI